MFIGHYVPALLAAAHPRAPRLGTLFVATQLVDLAFFAFALLGIEHFRLVPGFTVTNAFDLYDLPYTHSLLGTLAFAAGWALVARPVGSSWTAAYIGAAVVASHWFLDLLVHPPDLTIAGIGPRHGLGLWNRPQVEMPLELGLVAVALIFYASRTRAAGRAGDLPLWLLTATLFAAQMAHWRTPQPSSVIDPPPASLPLIALAGYAALAGLAWWATARRARPGSQP